MSRTIRCVACARRVRENHPHLGVVDLETGSEWTYHARPKCQLRARQETATRIRQGKVYVMRHYHVCGDEAPGADCSGGCFSGEAA
jgi:hypothetical protein